MYIYTGKRNMGMKANRPHREPSVFNSAEQIAAHSAGVALGESCARIGVQTARMRPTQEQADKLAEILYVGLGCTPELRAKFAEAILKIANRQFDQQ
jgi:hypothetical protein